MSKGVVIAAHQIGHASGSPARCKIKNRPNATLRSVFGEFAWFFRTLGRRYSEHELRIAQRRPARSPSRDGRALASQVRSDLDRLPVSFLSRSGFGCKNVFLSRLWFLRLSLGFLSSRKFLAGRDSLVESPQ